VDSVANELVEALTSRAQKLRYGDPADPDTDMGTVVHAQAAEMFQRRVDDALSLGAELLYGNLREGALYSPTVVDRVPFDCELVREETFGPVIPVIRCSDIDDVIRKSNSTAFGLSSGVCTNNLEYVTRFIHQLQVGTVNVWEVPGYRTEMSPFGGIKDSGLGYKEGVLEAMRSYTNLKTYSLPW
jgi:acyl-CoA reductase-like NAD-dependent aldehyde dehydrogenase